MNITLDLPDELAARLKSMPVSDRNHYALAALALGMDSIDELKRTQPEYDDSADEADFVAAVRDAIARYDAGERGRPIDAFWAEMDAKYGPVSDAQ